MADWNPVEERLDVQMANAMKILRTMIRRVDEATQFLKDKLDEAHAWKGDMDKAYEEVRKVHNVYPWKEHLPKAYEKPIIEDIMKAADEIDYESLVFNLNKIRQHPNVLDFN